MLPVAAWACTQRSKDDLGTVIPASTRMSRKTEREIPRASNGPTRRAMISRWSVGNSVDEYFLDIGGVIADAGVPLLHGANLGGVEGPESCRNPRAAGLYRLAPRRIPSRLCRVFIDSTK